MFQALYDKYPQVSPQCFMTDKDLANIFAFNHLGIRYLLCNWHIYTAIIKEIAPSVATTRREIEERKIVLDQIIHLFKAVQRSAPFCSHGNDSELTCEDCRLDIPEKTKNSIKILYEYCSEWPKVVTYFEKNWFSNEMMEHFIDAVKPFNDGLFGTNNYSESGFRNYIRRGWITKKRGLPLHKLIKLTGTIYQHYALIRKQRNEGRLPVYSSDRSRSVKQRTDAGYEIFLANRVKSSKNSLVDCFLVGSETQYSIEYLVMYNEKTCTCDFYISKGQQCKHIFAVEFFIVKEVKEGRLSLEKPLDDSNDKGEIDETLEEDEDNDNSESDEINIMEHWQTTDKKERERKREINKERQKQKEKEKTNIIRLEQSEKDEIRSKTERELIDKLQNQLSNKRGILNIVEKCDKYTKKKEKEKEKEKAKEKEKELERERERERERKRERERRKERERKERGEQK